MNNLLSFLHSYLTEKELWGKTVFKLTREQGFDISLNIIKESNLKKVKDEPWFNTYVYMSIIGAKNELKKKGIYNKPLNQFNKDEITWFIEMIVNNYKCCLGDSEDNIIDDVIPW